MELAATRVVTLPPAYLARRTQSGGPSVVHGYAGTAHIAQGTTTDRAFVLGSDAAYREWGYVAWSRARLQTRFYISEPEASEHHSATTERRDPLDDLGRTLQRSQGQSAAVDLLDGEKPCQPHALRARRDPPPYLVAALGDRPAHPDAAQVWDRAARLIERYRADRGIEDATSALGPSPGDLLGQVAWRRASRALDQARRDVDDRGAPRTSTGRFGLSR